MASEQTSTTAQIDSCGFALLSGVFRSDEVRGIASDLEDCLQSAPRDDRSIRSRGGVVYAARNLLSLFPASKHVWRKPVLLELLVDVLGERCGLVRGLFFDKPPEQSWSLPWHKDLTIAVKDNQIPISHFRNPTMKAGVPHLEAPPAVLHRMLTLRVHLDAATPENGALRVMPGSHEREADGVGEWVLASSGDVLAMRPMLSHCSGTGACDPSVRRRVLHFEFAAEEQLPDGVRWRTFSRCLD